MKNILIVTGHTHEENSVANKEILALLKEKYPKAEFDRLEVLYGDYKINVEAETRKALMGGYDRDSVPSILVFFNISDYEMV